MTDRRIRSIAVIGDGIVGLSAALAFRRALGEVTVTLVATKRDPAALADRMPTSLPSIHRFHALMAVDERELVQTGIAVHHLGTRFEDWSASGEPWVHAFRAGGDHADRTAIHHHWAAARRRGEAGPYHLYSAAGGLAEAGKFVHPQADGSALLGNHHYALRLDPSAYEGLLRGRLMDAGIHVTGSEFADVERRPDGGVSAVRLVSGERVEADLFLDCTGPSALLLSRVSEQFESWSHWFPFAMLVPHPDQDLAAPSPVETVRAQAGGWTVVKPLGNRTMSFSLVGENEGTRLTFGCRLPFVHNVLALGDAAVSLDPLNGANLHLAQTAILRAIDLLPGRDCHPVESAEYNRRTADEVRRARDFLALHYLRSGRADAAWRHAAAGVPPQSLARTLDQFEERGRLPFFEEEVFNSESWVMALVGIGVLPRNQDAESLKVAPERAAEALQRRAGELQRLIPTLPSYAAYLGRMKAA